MTRWPCTSSITSAPRTGFNFEYWQEFFAAAVETGVISEAGWAVATAVATVGDDLGSISTADLLAWIEADETHENALITAIDGCRELVAVHLLHDFGERLVAVLPAILVRAQED